ncbi:hypothetical protein Zmor_023460 [Zophobas morio]|uniref:STING ligand-binding domain-containing protein n=1 Tax=Zophobas morio TaxID=2755281 RepID=A0AA38M7V6_9CUCU|nr:hypothetical protein Zmor_023458 [Zophobas morio]KAJ3645832.1 hypothetical protein Zmor_023460 [Zophobas morio]
MNNTVGTKRNARTKKTLPRTRSNLTTLLIYVVSSGFFFLSSITNNNINLSWTDAIFTLISVLIPLLCLIELGFRILYAAEEKQHLITRYENNYRTLLKDVFYFSFSITLVAVMAFFTHIIMYIRFEQSSFILWYNMGPFSLMLSIISAFLLQRNLDLKCGPLYDSLWIGNSNGLDYGSGMAHSFFHGYLRLIIPKTGTSEKNLEELMKDYEDEHHVKLEFYKLFILIPKSLYCPTSLKNDDISPSIEESSSLRPKEMTVAGVQNRVYKNSVYKIRLDKDKKVYVSAEYATPLKTFKDVVSYNGEHSKHYKKHKNDIVLQFYLTLQKVLKEHENCTNFCELIFYDDKDENGKYKDVGQILLQRIKKLRKLNSNP